MNLDPLGFRKGTDNWNEPGSPGFGEGTDKAQGTWIPQALGKGRALLSLWGAGPGAQSPFPMLLRVEMLLTLLWALLEPFATISVKI